MRIALLSTPAGRFEDISYRAIYGGLAAGLGELGHQVDGFFWQKRTDGLPLCEERPWGRLWRLRGWLDLVRAPIGQCDFAILLVGGFRGSRVWVSPLIPTWLICRLRHPQVPMGIGVQDFIEDSDRWSPLRTLRIFLRSQMIRRSSWATATSRAIWESIVRGDPSLGDRLSIIPNGYDSEEIDAAALNQERGVIAMAEKKFVLCCARLAPYKGIDVLLMAWSALASQAPGVELRILGPDQSNGHYQRLATHLGLSRSVRFLGQTDRAEVLAQMRSCLFLVLPSRTEAFGMAALEAMACGKAVLATRTGVADYVEHGVSGLLTEPSDVKGLEAALSRLLQDSELRQRLGAAARQAVQGSHRWTAIARRYLSLAAAVKTAPRQESSAKT